jgi:hypothetical protein
VRYKDLTEQKDFLLVSRYKDLTDWDWKGSFWPAKWD